MLFEHAIFRWTISLFLSIASEDFNKFVLHRRKCFTQEEIGMLFEKKDNKLVTSELEIVEKIPPLVQELQDTERNYQVDDITAAAFTRAFILIWFMPMFLSK